MSKTILVTGASTGIGAAIAARLAAGNHVFVHYRSSVAAAEDTAAAVESAGGRATLVAADLSTEAGCDALAAAVHAATDSLDVLVNNAGGLVARVPGDALTFEHLMATFALNTFSAMRMSALCIPLLRKGVQPTIINMTSIAMRHGAPTATAYGASKGALDTYTRGLAKELAPTIRVNAVAPGVIDTPFHEKASTPEKMRAWSDSTPLGRNGVSQDIADAVAYLVDAPFVTGACIDVNGGMSMV